MNDDEVEILFSPVLPPPEFNFFDEVKHHTTLYAEMYAAIDSLGTYTTKHIEQCFQDEEEHKMLQEANEEYFASHECHVRGPLMREMQRIYDQWLQNGMVRLMEPLKEVRTDQVTEERRTRNVLGANIFWELGRLHWLMSRTERVRQEEEEDATKIDWERNFASRSFKTAKHPMWLEAINTFDVEDVLDEEDKKQGPDDEIEMGLSHVRAIWDKCFLDYTQHDVYLAVLLLTQLLNDVPTVPKLSHDGEDIINGIDEFKDVFYTIWLRAMDFGVQLWQGTEELNMDNMRKKEDTNLYQPNRDWYAFMFFFMGDILKRIFWYEKTIKWQFPLPEGVNADRTRSWVTEMLKTVAEEAFVDLYLKHVDEGYKFVGDDMWFKYLWPKKSHSRAACLGALRPHLHKRYFTEDRLTLETILVGRSKRHITRYFILNMVSDYLKMKTGHPDDAFNWFDAAVIPAEAVELASDLIVEELCPLVIQVFSSYWVFCKKRMYACDDVFVAIALWFKLLREEYGGVFHGRDWNAMLDKYEPMEQIGGEEAMEKESEIDWSEGI